MNKPIIEVKNLSKKYTLGERQPYYSFRDTISGIFHKPFLKEKLEKDEFWALKDVSFDINQGDVVGVIGRNGAGKSTLLKILSQITPPTEGEVKLRGRVASLLEVGTGFHFELTGRENIYLNGAILGMKRCEINSKFKEIVDFSEIEKFLDTPVKHYSSGMYMRLAFAVAAHLESEILMVDEVLAVGDVQFQKKCLGKMSDISKQGRTVLFVSHNMGAISELCSNTILLKDSGLAAFGKTKEVISKYLSESNGKLSKNEFTGTLKSKIIFSSITINEKKQNIVISSKENIIIEVEGECLEEIPSFKLTFSVYTNGIRLFSAHDSDNPQTIKKGKFNSSIEIPKYILRPGEYSIALGGYRDGSNEWLYGTDLQKFQILEEWNKQNKREDIGLINIQYEGKRIG